MVNPIFSWFLFAIIIFSLIVFDLGVLNKKDKVISFRESLILSIFYILISCLFGVYVYIYLGSQSGKEYFTGFVLEKAMSLDNIFIISIIFKFFSIPLKYQHRVLFWGIIGVIVLRAIMIMLGATLLMHFSWILYIFAIILIITGVKTFCISEHAVNIKEMYVYKILKKYCNIIPEIKDNSFFVTQDNKLFITPLFMALVTVETMDLIFAIDSIPAIFAITQDIYIVYTSNIFAILGLRALFFCLANIVNKFRYVKYSLAIILIVIGMKIFIHHFIAIPTYIPLVVTLLLLLLGILLSIIIKPSEK
ncbi:MAG: TerC/Alx family metal homeostasis membrane protein [Rickettsiaceae bacterium]|nr:TerC/Alx family metal homeostasis membrane protein [Rickettsiaceae bacterium]